MAQCSRKQSSSYYSQPEPEISQTDYVYDDRQDGLKLNVIYIVDAGLLGSKDVWTSR
jgi:hypothetical protein